MDLMEAVRARHSVRSYLDTPIEAEKVDQLRAFIDECNGESGLRIQLILEEPRAFSGFFAHYGMFSGVKNYIALVGEKEDKDLEEKCGYQGEKIVLRAQQLGLNTCWVGLTYRKVPGVIRVREYEKLVCVIALGYGSTQGKARRSKAVKDVVEGTGHPDWFIRGAEAALLAPTAVNQQKFRFSRRSSLVMAKAGRGPYSKVDLGIVKCHFEIGAGKDRFMWDWEMK